MWVIVSASWSLSQSYFQDGVLCSSLTTCESYRTSVKNNLRKNNFDAFFCGNYCRDRHNKANQIMSCVYFNAHCILSTIPKLHEILRALICRLQLEVMLSMDHIQIVNFERPCSAQQVDEIICTVFQRSTKMAENRWNVESTNNQGSCLTPKATVSPGMENGCSGTVFSRFKQLLRLPYLKALACSKPCSNKSVINLILSIRLLIEKQLIPFDKIQKHRRIIFVASCIFNIASHDILLTVAP